MDVGDYYADSLTSKTMYNLGRGVRAVEVVTMENINPLKASAVVAAAWGAVSGLINIRRYRKGKITKKEAVVDTASESIGLGLSAGLGLFVSNVVRTSLVAASVPPSLLPFIVGVIVTSSAKSFWNSKVRKQIGNICKASEQGPEVPTLTA